MIGQGSVENKIKEKVNKLGLNENVIFAGFRKDVNRYMQAMDIFAFPSLYEGLGLVLVEAQASGLPCFATKETIPDDVKINDNFYFLDLDKEIWENNILKCNLNRVDSIENMKRNEYLIDDVVKKLENIYIQNYK